MPAPLLVIKSDRDPRLLPGLANCHGLITGVYDEVTDRESVYEKLARRAPGSILGSGRRR
jgi:hypothetical protein